jgi:cyclomaltodextrinase / maltogenic alpha-amylase / neopullulanase
MLQFSPYSTLHKKPGGAAATGSVIRFSVLLPRDYDAFYPIIFAVREDGKGWKEHVCRQFSKMENGERLIGVEWSSQKEAIYFYKFFAKKPDGTTFDETPVYQQTVYRNDFTTPDWLSGGLMYQIFPDRFRKSGDFPLPSMNKDWVFRDIWGEDPFAGPDENGIVKNNDFFGGNLRGIEESLPYLENLGVTVIYLNPIFEAYSNHRYDTANYMKIDPLLGTVEDFRNLCAEAKKRGIRIILDGVFNHTGSHSVYFNKDGSYDSIGAYQSQDSPYYRWYSFASWPHEYASWWGIDTLPGLCEEEPSLLNYLIKSDDSVIAYWLRAGASGFRLDVADELPDGFLDALRDKIKSIDKDACIIGEVWEDATNKMAYDKRRKYFLGTQLDSVMHYPLKKGILQFLTEDGDGKNLEEIILSIQDHYPGPAWKSLMNILGTHDTERIRTVLSHGVSDAEAKNRLYAALLIWAFMPGIPCIYYGDEIGMQGGKDPMNRRCFEPEWADGDVQEYYKEILGFRRKVFGLSDMVLCGLRGEKGWFSFIREGCAEKLYIAVNMTGEDRILTLEGSDVILEVLSNRPVAAAGSGVVVPSECAVCIKAARGCAF